jgi:iron complex outermembrane receptor protein
MAFQASCRSSLWFVFLCCLVVFFTGQQVSAQVETEKRSFDISVGYAINTLKEAAQQAEVEFIFSADLVKGVRTPSIQGEYTPLEAFSLMLAETSLDVFQHEQSGVYAITKVSDLQIPELEQQPIEETEMKPRNNNWLKTLAAVLTLGMAANINAQSESDEIITLSPFEVTDSDVIEYGAESATIATGFGSSLKNTPLSVSVLTESLLEDLGGDELRDMVSFAAGVSGDRQGDLNVTIRGFTADVQRNGLTSFGSTAHNVERIEFVKGPASIFLGTTRPGGAMNYVTRKPTYQQEGRLKLGLGTRDYSSVSFMSRGPLLNKDGGAKLAYLATGRLLDRNHWRDFTGLNETHKHFALDFRPFNGLKIYGAYDYVDNTRKQGNFFTTSHEGFAESGADPSVTLQAWVRENFGVPGITDKPPSTIFVQEEMYPGGGKFNAQGPDAHLDRQSDTFNWEVEWLPNDSLAIRHFGSQSEQNMDEFVIGNAFRARAGNVLNDGWQYRLRKFASLNHKTELVWLLDTDSFSNKLLVGYEARKARNGTNSFRTDRVVWNPRTEPFPAESNFAAAKSASNLQWPNLDDVRYVTSEFVYIAEQLSLMNDRVTIVGGGRYFMPGDRQNNSEEDFTPLIGSSVKLSERVSIYANASESIRPRNIIDAFGLIVPSETGEGWEVGMKWDSEDNRFTGSASYFENSLTNIARPDFVAASELGIGPIYVLSGEEASEGIEFEAQFSLNDNYQAAISATHFFVAETVNHLNTPEQVGVTNWRTPDYMFRMMNKYTFTEGVLEGLSIGGLLNYTGRTHLHPSWQVDLYENGYFLANAFATYRSKWGERNVTYRLQVDNLFEEYYFEYTFLPGDKRNVFLSVDIEF